MTRSAVPVDAAGLLRAVMLANPTAGEKEAFNAFTADLLTDNQHLIPEIVRYWFVNHFRRLRVVETGPHSRALLATERKARSVSDRRAVDKIKTKLKSRLMDTVLSNGKALRDCTFGELGAEAGWLLAVSRQGRANEIVGRKLTEADLVAIRDRSNSRAYVA